jgi:hypothetical protein
MARRQKSSPPLSRAAVGLLLLVLSSCWLLTTWLGALYVGSTGCEDYAIACHTADPDKAVAIGVVGALGNLALFVAAVSALVRGPRGRVFSRSCLAATVLLAAWLLAIVAS